MFQSQEEDNLIERKKMISPKPNSAVAMQHCPSGPITADKRLRWYAPFPKSSLATSFIRKTLGAMPRYKRR